MREFPSLSVDRKVGGALAAAGGGHRGSCGREAKCGKTRRREEAATASSKWPPLTSWRKSRTKRKEPTFARAFCPPSVLLLVRRPNIPVVLTAAVCFRTGVCFEENSCVAVRSAACGFRPPTSRHRRHSRRREQRGLMRRLFVDRKRRESRSARSRHSLSTRCAGCRVSSAHSFNAPATSFHLPSIARVCRPSVVRPLRPPTASFDFRLQKSGEKWRVRGRGGLE